MFLGIRISTSLDMVSLMFMLCLFWSQTLLGEDCLQLWACKALNATAITEQDSCAVARVQKKKKTVFTPERVINAYKNSDNSFF